MIGETELEGKPKPAVYQTVAGKMNVDPEHCAAIQDSVSGIIAAKRAGMHTILMADENVVVEDGLVDYRI
jgi:mannitol-1-/sugar-/sorbitol-6-/2-deoxyglucose-6-phosphatase